MKQEFLALVGLCPVVPLFWSCTENKSLGSIRERTLPNVLFVIADDLSYPYCSYYGDKTVSTPGFDFVAGKGVCFTNAYCSSPGSSPSRASLLTGLYPWQIEQAGTHASSFPSKYLCFPDVFAQAGYETGFTGKGWGPGDWKVSGRTQNPAGPEYNELKLDPPYSGISKIDYCANFKKFLEGKDPGKPFCFWYGSNEPHRAYQKGSWQSEGKDPARVSVPTFLPDTPEIREDLLDFAVETEWCDKHLVGMLDILREKGLLDNTIIIVTADNGMPFPHAKANCYDEGTHIPLAICWGDRLKAKTDDASVVSLVDIFPTLIDLCGIKHDCSSLSGESLAPLLGLGGKGFSAKYAFHGRERHSCARIDNLGYPIRSVRWNKWLLIHNFHPERWPAGAPHVKGNDNPLDGYCDIDGCPSKTFMINNQDRADVKPFFEAAVAKRPEFELFNLSEDPGCMHDLASDKSCRRILKKMKKILERELRRSNDSRVGDNPEIWESYPRLSGVMREFDE